MPRVFLIIARILVAGAACLAVCGVFGYVVETLRHRGPDSFLTHFGDYRPSVEPRIGIGDTVAGSARAIEIDTKFAD